MGVAGALLLGKVVWDHSRVHSWVYTKLPDWVYDSIPSCQKRIKLALHNLRFRNEEKWRQWFQQQEQFETIYNSIKGERKEDFNTQMTEALFKYVETAPSIEEVQLFIEKSQAYLTNSYPVGVRQENYGVVFYQN